MYCGLSTASEVFLIFTTQLYQYLSVLFLFAIFSDEPEVFLPKYSQTAILYAAYFRRVLNVLESWWANDNTITYYGNIVMFHNIIINHYSLCAV